jgi:AcrR family transcriptional regulator
LLRIEQKRETVEHYGLISRCNLENDRPRQEAGAMTTPKRRVDRRVQRTRQVLQQAFIDSVRDKGFAATSVQEITERANVNRGTFYLHFEDKFTLTDTVVREMFHQHLAGMLPAEAGWDRCSLRLLIQAVLECFEGKYRHQPRPLFALAEVAPLVERVIQEELTGLLLTWLKQARRAETHGLVPIERIASVVSWAIFGPAVQWSQEPITVPSEQIANQILLVIVEGVAQLVPAPALGGADPADVRHNGL